MSTFRTHKPIAVIRHRFKSFSKIENKLLDAIVKDIETWYLNNGPQFTVDRMKYIKQLMIHQIACPEEVVKPPKVPNSEVWFAKNKRGNIKGHWGTLISLARTKRSQQQAIDVIQAFTVFVDHDEPSVAKISKFCETVEAPFTGIKEHLDIIESDLYGSSKEIIKAHLPRHKKYLIHKDLRSPGNYINEGRFNNLGHVLMAFEDSISVFSNREFQRITQCYLESLSLELGVEEIQLMKESNSYNMFAKMNDSAWADYIKPTPVGQVNYLSEPGLKDRIVTDFFKPLEHLTKPLGDRLYDIIKYVPWDTTYHEAKGYETIKQQIRQGKKSYCFDLSKATDRFPLSLQIAVLLSLDLGPEFMKQVDILWTAVTSPVKLPGNYGQTIFKVGQPMGSYPSFGLFSLTHGLVLMSYLHSNGEAYDNQFVVHGDDLVIFEDDLALWYENHFLPASGVENNPFKTVISSFIAEYNSRIITKDKFIFMRKYRPLTLESLGDSICHYGNHAINWAIPDKRLKAKFKHDAKMKLAVEKENSRRELKRQITRDILSLPNILQNTHSYNPENIDFCTRLNKFSSEELDIIYHVKPQLEKSYLTFSESTDILFSQSDSIIYESLGFFQECQGSYTDETSGIPKVITCNDCVLPCPNGINSMKGSRLLSAKLASSTDALRLDKIALHKAVPFMDWMGLPYQNIDTLDKHGVISLTSQLMEAVNLFNHVFQFDTEILSDFSLSFGFKSDHIKCLVENKNVSNKRTKYRKLPRLENILNQIVRMRMRELANEPIPTSESAKASIPRKNFERYPNLIMQLLAN